MPLPRTETERARLRGPRPSIEREYGARDAFLGRVDGAAAQLVAQRFLLRDDVDAARGRMAAMWDWIDGLSAR